MQVHESAYIDSRCEVGAGTRIGWMSRAGGRLGEDLVCPIDGTRYRLTGRDCLEEDA